MRLICLLFLAGLAQGILGKAVTVSDDEDFDFDILRERRSPDFDDEDEDDLSDDYDSFYEHREKPVPSSDYSVPYEFPVSESSLRAADAASDLKGLGAGLKAAQAKLAQLSKEMAALAAKAAKAVTDLAKAQAAAKAAAAKAAVAKAAAAKAAAKKPAAKAAAAKAASSKTVSYNVVVRLPQEVYNPKLQVTTSKEYQTLGKKLQDAVVALYNTAKTKELLGFKVNSLKSGSVVADLGLKFDAAVKDPLKKLKDLLKKGKLGGLVVDPSFLKVYNKKGIICSGACPSCASTACPSASPYPAPVPAPAPVLYPAPAPVYAPAAPIMCPATCPVSCCAPQPVCPTGCAVGCCVNQGR